MLRVAELLRLLLELTLEIVLRFLGALLRRRGARLGDFELAVERHEESMAVGSEHSLNSPVASACRRSRPARRPIGARAPRPRARARARTDVGLARAARPQPRESAARCRAPPRRCAANLRSPLAAAPCPRFESATVPRST